MSLKKLKSPSEFKNDIRSRLDEKSLKAVTELRVRLAEKKDNKSTDK